MSSNYMKIILAPPTKHHLMPTKRFLKSDHSSLQSPHLLQHWYYYRSYVSLISFNVGIWNPLMNYHFTKTWFILSVVVRFFLWRNSNIKQDKKITIKREINDKEKNKKRRLETSTSSFPATLFSIFYLNGGTNFCVDPYLFKAIIFWYLFILNYLNRPLSHYVTALALIQAEKQSKFCFRHICIGNLWNGHISPKICTSAVLFSLLYTARGLNMWAWFHSWL